MLTPDKKKHFISNNSEQTGSGWIDAGQLLNTFMEHGLFLNEAEAGKYYVTCPNASSHSETNPKDTVLWWDGSRGNFHCSHDHCSHIKLHEVAEMLGMTKQVKI